MLSESLEFYGKGSRAMLSIGLARVYQHIQAIGHRWLYQATPSPKNVVVLGGSYAGIHLAQRLTETLPTGYRAVLIKKTRILTIFMYSQGSGWSREWSSQLSFHAPELLATHLLVSFSMFKTPQRMLQEIRSNWRRAEALTMSILLLQRDPINPHRQG